jgi:hypothetical protein
MLEPFFISFPPICDEVLGIKRDGDKKNHMMLLVALTALYQEQGEHILRDFSIESLNDRNLLSQAYQN